MCTSFTSIPGAAPLDQSGDEVGEESSITIGADGLALISYRDKSNNRIKVAKCADIFCSGGSVQAIFSTTTRYPSITIGADGLGLISHYDSGDLKVAHCQNIACTSITTSTLTSDAEVIYTSITIVTDGLPLISYVDSNSVALKLAHCENTFCAPYFRRR